MACEQDHNLEETAPSMTNRKSDGLGPQPVAAEQIVIDGLMGGVLTPRVIERLGVSGVTAINLTAVRIGATLAECLSDLAAVRETIDRNSRRLQLVTKAADIRSARAAGRVGIIIGMQDTEPIGRNLYVLRTLHDIGVRIIQVTHNRQCYVGTGCVEPDSGLTAFGRQLVAEMNRLGLVVDLSHCGPKTTLDAIRYSSQPVMCTHANPLAVCPSPRNKSDEIITELAARGGVIGTAAWSPILYRGNRKRPSLSDLNDCIDHVLRIAGPDHVGIGTDLCDDLTPTPESWAPSYGPGGIFPEVTAGLGDWYRFETTMAEGLDTIAQMPTLIEMVRSRYAPPLAGKILGLNFMRVFEAVTGD
jgi:membrane dipeptidase